MRYIDITTTSGIVQNVLAIDLEFELLSDSSIILSKTHLKNLAGMNKLDEAMEYLDNLTSSISEGSLTLFDENGQSYSNISKIIFDEVIVTGDREATVFLDGSLDNTINNINNNKSIYEGIASKLHIFNHNMDSEYLNINVWVYEEIGWQNSIVPITILDNNSVQVQLSIAKPIRIIIENINNISKTFGI